MRTIKTAVAVTLDVAIAYALRLEYPFYAAIASIVVLQMYTRDTVTAGKNRLLGTVAGGLVASVFFLIPVNRSISSGIGIIVLFFLLTQLRMHKSMVIAGIVFMRVMVDLEGETPLAFTFNRTLATIVGVIVAIGINLLFFPYHRTRDNEARMETLKERLFAEAAALAGGQAVDLPGLQAAFDHAQGHLNKNHVEYKVFRRKKEQVEELLATAGFYREAIRHMGMVLELPAAQRRLDGKNCARLAAFFPGGGFAPTAEGSETDIICNYHVARMLDNLEESEKSFPVFETPALEAAP